ncbi:uncharacterized protein J3D65DRAFT_606826 [Phyllosticta citribraziliensis]|uniref:NACHT domain-containing protein n=1 Tax=Phyllosticta citribraziliensis TaxID=989973 RepID=A0ABR1L937_9PEZI
MVLGLFGGKKQEETPCVDIERQDPPSEGLFILHDDGPDAVADVCFVHGLGGHPEETWSKGDCCWPQQLLPKTFSRRNIKIRILSFGYDARPAQWEAGSNNSRVWGIARKLMHQLGDFAEDLGPERCNRPIVFVGHSLGGLVIKSVVCQSLQRSSETSERKVLARTAGIVFLATPHHGSDFAKWANYFQAIFVIAQRAPNKNLIEVLTPDAAQLKDLGDGFNCVAKAIRKYCCYETKSTVKGARDDLLSTLEAPELFERDRYIADPQSSTFQWLMDGSHPPFVNFLRGDDTLFWIVGKAGSGKSTLMKSLLKHPALRTHLDVWSPGEPYAIASFFFHQQGHHLQNSLEGLLKSLLSQLLRQVPEFLQILQRHNHRSGSWTVKELRDAFRECMAEIPPMTRIFLCIDALDEYISTEQRPASSSSVGFQKNNQLEIALFLGNLAREGQRVKICVSGRPYEEFRAEFDSAHCLRLHDFTGTDILTYIDEGFHGIQDSHWRWTAFADEYSEVRQTFLNPSSVRELVREAIFQRSSGIFLWVKLVVARLRDQVWRGCPLSQLIDSLDKQNDLEGLIESMWGNVPKESREQGLVYIYMLQKSLGRRTSSEEYLNLASFPTMQQRWTTRQFFSGNFGELDDEKLFDLEPLALCNLQVSCGQLLGWGYGRVEITHQSVINYFSSDQFAQLNALDSIDLDDVKAKADRCAAASFILQLWNPKHLRSRPRDVDPQYWVFETIRMATRCIEDVVKRGEITKLDEQLLEAASSRQLLSWAFGLEYRTFCKLYGSTPRGEIFRNFCLREFWNSETLKDRMPKSETKERSLVEMLFELVLVDPKGHTYVEDMWSDCDLSSDMKTKFRGLTPWEYCLALLVFFEMMHLTPFVANEEIRPWGSPRCPRASVMILQDLVVQLIQKGADPCASIEVHRMTSRKWKGAQPVWALSCYKNPYLSHSRVLKGDIDQVFRKGRKMSALRIVGRIFGEKSEAWKLLLEKGARLESDEFENELIWRLNSRPSTAFNSTNVALSDGCVPRRPFILEDLMEERQELVDQWAPGQPDPSPMSPLSSIISENSDSSRCDDSFTEDSNMED